MFRILRRCLLGFVVALPMLFATPNLAQAQWYNTYWYPNGYSTYYYTSPYYYRRPYVNAYRPYYGRTYLRPYYGAYPYGYYGWW